jgi:hypothetical protein
MAEATAVAAPVADTRGPGLFARLIGVIFSPRATYQAVVARPRVLGAFVVTIAIMALTEGAFFSTPVMQEVLMDMQVKTLESFGVNITDQMYDRLEQGIGRQAYTTPLSLAIGIPIVAAICAAIILGIWGMLMGGTGTFKQVYAILAHSGVHPRAGRPVHDAPQLRHPPAGGGATSGYSCRCSKRRRSGAVPRRHRPLLRVVVDQRRHRRGRAVQAKDRRHRRHVRRDVCGGGLWCSRSCRSGN